MDFDNVRRRRQGQEARDRVFARLNTPTQATSPIRSSFDSVRNRPLEQPMKIKVPAKAFNQPEREISIPELHLSSIGNWDSKLQKLNASSPLSPEQQSRDEALRAQDADFEARIADDPEWSQNLSRFFRKTFVTGPVGKNIDRLSKAMARGAGIDPGVSQDTGSEGLNKTLDIAGNITGLLSNPARMPGGMVTAPYNAPITQTLANAAGSRVSSPLGSRVATEVVREGIAGAHFGAARSLLHDEVSPQELATNIASDAVLGAGIGAALPMVGAAFRNTKLGQRFSAYLRGPAPTPEQPELLALPAPRPKPTGNPVETPDVIFGQGKVEPIGLPEPNLAPPTRGRIERVSNPYRARLENFFEQARGIELPPGSEREYLETLWRRTGGNDVSLDELVDLAYPPSRITPDLAQRARASQETRDMYGVPLPAKSFGERYKGGVMSPVADPVERVGRAIDSPIRQPDEVLPASAEPTRPRIDVTGLGTRGSEVDTTGLRSLGNMASGIKENMYEALWKKVLRGDVTEGGVPSALLQVAKTIRDSGGIKTLSEFKALAAEVDQIRSRGIGGADYQAALRGVVRKYGGGDSSNVMQGGVETSPIRRVGESVPVQPEAPQRLSDNYADDGSKSFLDLVDDMESRMGLPSAADDISHPYERPLADDVADNSFAEEVAPRVRDKLLTFADDIIASAKADLAANRNRLSSMPVDQYARYAKLLSGYMLKGAVKLADATEILVREFGEQIRPHIREIFKQAKSQYAVIKKQIEGEELGLTGFEGQELKDLSRINLNTTDVFNNFRKVFGEHYPSVKSAVLDPFGAAKGAYVQEQNVMYDALYRDIVEGLGIKKGSKISADVQRYGEGTMTLDELKAKYPDKYKDIIAADRWFRERYDELIDRVNESISKIYPDNPDKLVPRRDFYYRHFREMSLMSDIQSLFDTTGSISPQLAGLSPFTKPKTKWASFKQKRGLGEFKNDAVGGFLDYIPSASYAIHIDPQISVFRNLAKHLADQTSQTKNLNNFIAYLNNFANDLAGKTSPIDRWIEEFAFLKGGGGRALLGMVNKFNNRVKKNVILGNVRSTLSQMANIPLGISQGGVDAPAGAARTVMSVFQPNPEMAKSTFLAERYLDKEVSKFARWWEKPEKTAAAMMRVADRVGTSFIWNTMHAKASRQGMGDPIKFADDETRRLVAGRGVGEVPLAFKSKLGGILAPFQLEVNNLWRIMKKNVDDRQFGALMTLFATNWLLNQGLKWTTGSGVVFDPIDALHKAITDEDATPLERGGRLAGEVLSNLPLGQTLALAYKENGMNIAGVDLPSRAELFGDKDPTRFGGGLVMSGGWSDPVYKLLFPFGGNQVKKTVQGAETLAKGGSYTGEPMTELRTAIFGGDADRKLRFPVASSPVNAAKTLAFGPYASEEGQEYTGEDRRPLSEKQTRVFELSPDPEAYYQRLMESRRRKTERQKRQSR